MKFSLLFIAAFAAVALADVTTVEADLALLVVPESLKSTVETIVNAVNMEGQNILTAQHADFALLPMDLYSVLHASPTSLQNALKDQQHTAIRLKAIDWHKAIDLSTPAAIDDTILEYFSLRNLGQTFADVAASNSWDAVTFHKAVQQAIFIYLAQESASLIESQNPGVHLIVNYPDFTPPPPPPPPTSPTTADVDAAVKQALDAYDQQIAPAYFAQKNALDLLDQKKGSDHVLYGKLFAQSKELENLHKTVSDLKAKLADKADKSDVTYLNGVVSAKADAADLKALEELNSKAADVSQKTVDTAEEVKQVAEDSKSDVLKAIGEELAVQAEALKQLSQKNVTESAPAVETPVAPVAPNVETPKVDTPVNATETPANVTEPSANVTETPLVETSRVQTPLVETPVAQTSPVANAIANSNSFSNSTSSSNSYSNSSANANVNIYFEGFNEDNYLTVYTTNVPVTTTDAAGSTVTTHTVSTITSTVCPKCTDDVVTVYTTDCPVTTTNAAGSAITTHTQSTVTSTVCTKCTKSDKLEDVVTVYVTDCPVTTTDAAGSTVITHTQSTVTSTVCTKCTKSATPSAQGVPTQQPRVVLPEQANGAVKAVVGAAMALPLLALL